VKRKGERVGQLDLVEQLDLRVGEVVEAQRVPNTRKVLRLVVALGSEQRQVIADLAHFYEAEEMLGQQVVVLAGFRPAIVHGLRSHGKLLLVHGEGEVLSFIRPDRRSNQNAKVR